MKKQFFASKYFILFIILGLSYSLPAQDSPTVQNAPVTTAATVTVCPSTTITVPVTVTATTITAMTLRIEYDSTVMTYNSSLTAISTQLPCGGCQKNNIATGVGSTCAIIIVWNNIFPATLANGTTVVTLGFNFINGSTALHFNAIINSGGDCDYAGSDYLHMNDDPPATYYHDGQVSSPSAGTVTGGSNITYGSSTGTLTLSGYQGSIIKWQKQYNGGAYSDIVNTNPTYSETPVYTGTWNYRAVVQYGTCPQANSTPTTVVVTSAGNSKTWTGSASTDWNNVSNWSPPGIPMLTENVSIPSGPSNMPIVSINGLGCNNLSVGTTGASLVVNPGIHLTVNGTLNIAP
jgi:hypothetical protein